MKILILKVLIISSVVLTCPGCQFFHMDEWYLINIVNNSSKPIYVCAAYQYPDTTLPAVKPKLTALPAGKISFIEGKELGDPKFKKLSTEKLTIFFSLDTVDRYDWSEVVKDYKVFKRLEILQSDLVNSRVAYR